MTMKQNNQPLSALQQCILKAAKRQETVGYNDILKLYYKFRPTFYRNGRKTFNLSWDEKRRIRAARVSICKSFNRLVARGLVKRVHEPGAWSCIAKY